ncbi:putative RiPP precursor [Mesorhizobium sp. B4-1-3]|nr:putative RiPP precursor [Mesorhizobium sp. B4-1-3]TPI10315.1 putative RiPP precursor [Mesorhizobium sp. B4-1-3]
MKKTYEKPVLVRKAKLSAIVAGPSVPPAIG